MKLVRSDDSIDYSLFKQGGLHGKKRTFLDTYLGKKLWNRVLASIKSSRTSVLLSCKMKSRVSQMVFFLSEKENLRGKVETPSSSLCSSTVISHIVFRIYTLCSHNFCSAYYLMTQRWFTHASPTLFNVGSPRPQLCPSSLLKCYDDTDILSQEFLLNHVDSRRGSLAIRRLNFIHAHYKIPNVDLLYTLCLLVLEPIRFIAKNWMEGEKQAQFVVWHDIGMRMGIKDIPHSLEEMDVFTRGHEAQHMAYSKSNRVIGDATLDMLLPKAPAPFRPFAKRLVYALFDERILKAMGYPRQPYWLVWSLEGMIRLCGGMLVWWCLPPRPMHWSTQRIPLQETEEEQELYKVRYDDYERSIYLNRYRITEVRNATGGRVGKTGQGRLLCPLACFPRNMFT